MIIPKKITIVSSIFLIFIIAVNISAQINAYHSIINPYKKSGLQIPSFAGYFSAVPARDGIISVNPAALHHLEKTNIALSGSWLHSISHLSAMDESNSSEKKRANHFYPGSISIFQPSSGHNPKMLLYLNYNPQVYNLNELGFLPLYRNDSFTDKRNGKPGSVTPGLIVAAMESWSVGLSWTKWFGRTKWNRTIYDADTIFRSADQVIQYNGSNFQISNYLDFNFIRFGLSYYTPLTLMTVSEDQKSLEFDGAYEIGLSSEIITGLTFAVNYFYQNSFIMKRWDDDDINEEKYSDGQELSVGIEYDNKLGKFPFPVFLMVKIDWLPEEHIGGDSNNKESPNYEVVFGTSLSFSNFTLLMSGLFRAHYTKIWETASTLPPHS